MASFDPLWVKIADFGTSKRLAHTALRTMVGTPGYLAPELLRLVPRTGNLEEFTYALDIWSLGCLVHELLTSQTPFCEIADADAGETWDESGFTVTGSQTDMGMLYQYCQGRSAFPTEVLQAAQVPQEGIDFVKGLLVADPRKRPEAVDAQRSPWLRNTGYRSPWFTDVQRECDTLGLDLQVTDKAGIRQLRTDDIAKHLHNIPAGKGRLTSLLERALEEGCYLFAALLTTSRMRLLEDPFGAEVMRLFTRGVEEGKVDWTKVLLRCVGDVNSTFDDGRTGLQAAVMRGHSVVAKLFLQRGAHIKVGTVRTVLQIAVENRNPEMVKVLLQSTESPFSTEHLRTALEIAVKTGCVRILELLLAYESLLANAEFNDQTLLQIAVENNQTEIVQLLLQQKFVDANANPSNTHGQTALEMASRNGSTEIVNLLLKHDAGSTLAWRVNTAFHAAVDGGRIETIKILLENGVDVNAPPNEEIFYRFPPPKPEAEINEIHRPRAQRVGGIWRFWARRSVAVADGTVRIKTTANTGRRAMHNAAGRGYRDVVQLLLDNGADVNVGKGTGTPLMAAVNSKNIEMVKLLLERNADPGPCPCASDNGRTILETAVQNGLTEIVKLLLARDVDINAKPSNETGRTVLETAIVNNNIGMAQLLLANRANIDGERIAGRRELLAAVDSNHIEMVQLLLDHGADINQFSSDRTPLEAAATHGYLGITELMLRHGADVNAKSYRKGRSALHGAAGRGHREVVLRLLEAGAETDSPSTGPSGRTALHEAVRNGHKDVVQLLISKETDINTHPTSRGRTVLRCAAEKHLTEIILLLLNNNAEINAQPMPEGLTALQGAIESGDFDTVNLLLLHGADVNAQPFTAGGKTSLQTAIGLHNHRITDLLKRHGARRSTTSRMTHVNGAQMRLSRKSPSATLVDFIFVLLVFYLRQNTIPLNRRKSTIRAYLKLAVSRDTGWTISVLVAALLRQSAMFERPVKANWASLFISALVKTTVSTAAAIATGIATRAEPSPSGKYIFRRAILERLMIDCIRQLIDRPSWSTSLTTPVSGLYSSLFLPNPPKRERPFMASSSWHSSSSSSTSSRSRSGSRSRYDYYRPRNAYPISRNWPSRPPTSRILSSSSEEGPAPTLPTPRAVALESANHNVLKPLTSVVTTVMVKFWIAHLYGVPWHSMALSTCIDETIKGLCYANFEQVAHWGCLSDVLREQALQQLMLFGVRKISAYDSAPSRVLMSVNRALLSFGNGRKFIANEGEFPSANLFGSRSSNMLTVRRACKI